MNTDELALRQMLHDLTAGQPPSPPGRYQAIRRRSVRQRRVQAATRSVVVAAVGIVAVVAAVLPASIGGHRATSSRTLPAWALAWPDHRDGSVPQRVLDGAVNAWRHLHGIETDTVPPVISKVIWYVGQTAGNGQDVIVTFEVSTSAGKFLVAGYATAASVLPGPSSNSSPWVLYSAPPPRRRADLVIGLNLAIFAGRGNQPDNWIMVLTAPDVRTVDWTAPIGAPRTSQGSSSAEASVGAATTDHGLVIADVGHVSGRVQVSGLFVGHRDILKAPVNVGVPGSVVSSGSQPSDIPELVAPAAVAPPSGFSAVVSLAHQGSMDVLLRNQIISRRPAVVIRCYGPQPVRVYLDSRLLGVIACDSNQHQLFARSRARPPVDVLLKTSFLTAWRLDIGSVP